MFVYLPAAREIRERGKLARSEFLEWRERYESRAVSRRGTLPLEDEDGRTRSSASESYGYSRPRGPLSSDFPLRYNQLAFLRLLHNYPATRRNCETRHLQSHECPARRTGNSWRDSRTVSRIKYVFVYDSFFLLIGFLIYLLATDERSAIDVSASRSNYVRSELRIVFCGKKYTK